MQHKDSVGKFGNVDDPENPLFIPDAYLPDSLPDCCHRLPIVWIAPSLQKIKLLTGAPSCRLGKAPESFQRISTELDRLAVIHLT
jgi:hypothetical protein